MSSDILKAAAFVAFVERGCPSEVAALATFALHPLDDHPAPSRAYEKQVRKLSKAFAHYVGKPAGGRGPIAIGPEAVKTVMAYRALAFELGETRYQTRFDKALNQV